MIISPRRWGKSSLVEKAVGRIRAEEKGVKVAMIDLFTVNSEEEFLEKFAGEVLKSASSKWEELVRISKKLFKNLVPKIQISPDPSGSISISFDWNEIGKHSDEILNLPEKIAEQKKIRIIVCLDEFQVIASFSTYEAMEKKLRAVWQRQKKVTYCIYGSQRHMMTEIFNNPSKPFYRFGDMVMLKKIERQSWVSFICDNFQTTGKKISTDEAGMIADLMQYHSWYVQQLAHYTWNLTRTGVTKTDIIRAMNEVINANMPFYQKEAEILSATQLNLLKAVASGERRLTSWSVMEKYRLGTPRNVSKNRDILLYRDIITDTGESFLFLDPMFELWFRKNFLNETIIANER